jgi:hypothetical protein
MQNSSALRVFNAVCRVLNAYQKTEDGKEQQYNDLDDL